MKQTWNKPTISTLKVEKTLLAWKGKKTLDATYPTGTDENKLTWAKS